MYVSTGPRKYWIEEKGAGPPLFLLHGFTGSSFTFKKIKAALSSSFRMISMDMPGHGKTGETGPISMEEFSADLKALITQFGYSKVHLLGYSMGGRAALSFAMLHPQHVETLMLESSSPGLVTVEEQVARQSKDQHHIEQLLQKGIPSFVDYWEALPLFKTQNRLPEKERIEIREERLSHTAQGLAESLEGMGTGKQPSWWKQLPNLNKKVLLITGEKDEKFVKLNQKMHDLLPVSELVKVKGAGHAVHVEDPRTFAKIVEEFML
ncbi:putative 2-succinyl-6-hydroxy-2,4-cyclohexadiene-1-carboxylate synthase [Halobacillus andaensis]|uniref:Putative 2-succinyl-6-hydroxy-2,4-cyclohexadiene-1-carboxylate synthase n=1 Tax=Halobacillus andaensis TaxID=1176239 RepID=A0A917B9G5_HALAA|nr:2-succinyl-6-hydroxy-2,4-cyclohexadiene-1-carboxylate synthase [Halobacillus andaensis]MBP2005618.1 2-succinyl-6-hydroxy-2,4-cyclohexadiene-1-carboxylate synthase [Halobacillus andaensis]GGF32918.1 putative 2-succinyl-6-hydroxy-2,4-cyclohexadiene-1-carboxylate synthase [Halobacillus andaensis]